MFFDHYLLNPSVCPLTYPYVFSRWEPSVMVESNPSVSLPLYNGLGSPTPVIHL